MVLFLRYEASLIILKDIYFIFSIPATALGLTPEPPSLILNIFTGSSSPKGELGRSAKLIPHFTQCRSSFPLSTLQVVQAVTL